MKRPRRPVVPPHYDKPIQPWDLERVMESSGNLFVDARRTDVIEYCFRIKSDLLGDLIKARHCLDAAIDALSRPVRKPRPPGRNRSNGTLV